MKSSRIFKRLGKTRTGRLAVSNQDCLDRTVAFFHQVKRPAEDRNEHLRVIQPQLMKNRGVEVAAIVTVLHGSIADFIGFAVSHAALDAAAR